jgi:hypothetical protein
MPRQFFGFYHHHSLRLDHLHPSAGSSDAIARASCLASSEFSYRRTIERGVWGEQASVWKERASWTAPSLPEASWFELPRPCNLLR